MRYYLLDVESTVNVNGIDVAFDYINTYYSADEAIKEAKLLSMNEDVLDVGVHVWTLDEKGKHEHTGDILYRFLNETHRELT